MKNQEFYKIVSKTKLLNVFENNRVMYNTYFGEGGPTPEPTIVHMSITGHPYSADIGSLVKSLLQVTVVYDDGSSRELEQDEYQTNWALIDEGPNYIEVTYKEFTDTCTIIGLQPEPPAAVGFMVDELQAQGEFEGVSGGSAIGKVISIDDGNITIMSGAVYRDSSPNYNYPDAPDGRYKYGLRFEKSTNNKGIHLNVGDHTKLSLIGRSSSTNSPRNVVINGNYTEFTFHQSGQDVSNAVAKTEIDLTDIKSQYGDEFDLGFSGNADICQLILE